MSDAKEKPTSKLSKYQCDKCGKFLWLEAEGKKIVGCCFCYGQSYLIEGKIKDGIKNNKNQEK